MIYTKYNDDINIQSSYVAYNTSTYPFRSLKNYSRSTRGKWMIPRMYFISCLSFTQHICRKCLLFQTGRQWSTLFITLNCCIKTTTAPLTFRRIRISLCLTVIYSRLLSHWTGGLKRGSWHVPLYLIGSWGPKVLVSYHDCFTSIGKGQS